MPPIATINPTPSERHRFHLLDALRGLAAIVVFFWHIPGRYTLQGRSNGYLAVDFFFCLSGFVVAFSYERRLMDNLRLKQFVLARMLRLHPLYFLGLLCGLFSLLTYQAFNFTLVHSLHLIGFFTLQALLIPNLGLWPSEFLFPFNDVSWSLFFELLANFVYAWAVARRLASTVQIVAVCIISALILSVFAFHKNSFDVGPWNHRGLPFAVARVLLSFCIGVLVMRAYRTGNHRPLSSLANGVLVSMTIAFLLLFLLFPFQQSHRLIATLLTVLIGFPIVLFAGARSRLSGPLADMASKLGNLSYPFYILHLSGIHVVERIQRPGWLADSLTGVAFALLVSIMLASIAFQYFDVPVRDWLSRRLRQSLSVHRV